MEDALEKAKALAAALSGSLKRKHDDPHESDVQTKKLYIPFKENPSVNFLGLLIGPKGSTQKRLQESSGAKIILRGRGAQLSNSISHPDDDDELHVNIEGTLEAIEKASKEINEILYRPEQATKLKETQLQSVAEINGVTASNSLSIELTNTINEYQIELRVPNQLMGYIIGKGGEMFHKLQAQTGAFMRIALESDMKPGETLRSVILRGNPVAVADLKIRIEDIINSKLNPISNKSTPTEKKKPETLTLDHTIIVKVPVPNDKVGVIIGKQGAMHRSIQEKSGATIVIPVEADIDNPLIRTLTIGAETKEAAEAAQMEIFIALEQHTNMNSGKPTEPKQKELENAMYITVPEDKVGRIIGKGGMKMKELLAKTRTRILIPPSADDGSNPPIRTITIIGPLANQHLAKYEIELIVMFGSGITGQTKAMQLSAQQMSGSGYYGWPNTNPSLSPMTAIPSTGAYGANMLMMPQQFSVMQQTPYQSMSGQSYPTCGLSTSLSGATLGYVYPTAATYTAPTVTTATSVTSTNTDPTAYYNDFWLYASYYGEAAARVYYGAWSPPEGTPNPNTNGTTAEPVTVHQTVSIENDKIETLSMTNPLNTATATDTATVTSTSITDDAEALRQWEEYKKQYAQWYEEHGRAAGADPNPTRP